MLVQAAVFLASVVPWPTPGWTGEFPPHYVGIHYTVERPGPTGKMERIFPGRACTSVEQAINNIEWRMANRPSDLYLCMAGLRQPTEKINAKTGRKYWNSWRPKANALWMKSVFADIDVKPGAYRTTVEAAEAYARFREQTGLPPASFIVMSGSGGFHIHYALTEAVPVERWEALTQKLVAAQEVHGFGHDHLADATRLLRIPQTFNYKSDPPKPTWLQASRGEYRIEYLEEILQGYHALPTAQVRHLTTPGGQKLDPALFPARAPLPSSDLGSGIERRTFEIDQVAAVCPLVDDALTHGGKNHQQPLWHALAALSTHVVNGRNAFLDMSDGHPAYDEADAIALYDRVEADHLSRNMGWTTCATLAGQGGSYKCGTCAHRLEGKSPFHFVARYNPPPPVPVSPLAQPMLKVGVSVFVDPPPPYERGPTGYITKSRDDGKGDEIAFNHPMRNIWVQHNPPAVNFESQFMDQKIEVHVPIEAVGTNDKIQTLMSKYGLPLSDPSRSRMMFMTFLEVLRDRKHVAVQAEPLGWASDLGSFVYGRYRYNGSGNQPSTMQDVELRKQYTPTGDLKAFTNALQLVAGRPDLETIIAVAFGAPLMRFTGKEGVILSAFSPGTGYGKSTALKISASVWGHPIASVASFNGTHNSLDKKIGTIRHLPLYCDEAQLDVSGRQDWLPLVFSIVQGKSKDRLDRQSQMQPTATWNTILAMASNTSMKTYLNAKKKTTQAHLVRVFEYEVKQPITVSTIRPVDADHIVSALADNYGNAGALYAEFLGKNSKRVMNEVQGMEQWVATQVQAQQDERFWIAAISVLLLGAMYSNEIGLTNVDTKAMFAFLRETLAQLRRYRINEAVNTNHAPTLALMLGEFVSTHQDRLLRTDIMPPPSRGPGRPPLVTVKTEPERLNRLQQLGVMMRYAENTRELYVRKTALTQALRDMGLEPETVIQCMTALVGAKPVRVTLSAGAPGKKFEGGQVEALVFDLTTTPLQGVLN
jgi:uncharacterized protein DUF927